MIRHGLEELNHKLLRASKIKEQEDLNVMCFMKDKISLLLIKDVIFYFCYRCVSTNLQAYRQTHEYIHTTLNQTQIKTKLTRVFPKHSAIGYTQ